MDDTTKVWRYIDLARFITLLSRGVHFSRSDALGDDWEGSWGVGNLEKFREEYFGRPDEGAAKWEARVNEKRRALAAVGVSCWHRSDHESAALWDLYIPQGLGVAVQSTVGRITSAASAIDRTLEVPEVQYVDFEQGELVADPSVLLGQKRLEFVHENEVRFLLRFTEDEQKAIGALQQAYSERDTRWMSLSPTAGLVKPGPAIALKDDTALARSSPAGVHLPLAPASVIEKVHLSPGVPQPVRYAVRDVAATYGLDVKVVAESSRDLVAPDKLRFFT